MVRIQSGLQKLLKMCLSDPLDVKSEGFLLVLKNSNFMANILVNHMTKYNTIAQILVNGKINIQLAHWKTVTKTLAEHEALGDLYSSLDDIIDRFVECSQGSTDTILTITNLGEVLNIDSLELVTMIYNKLITLRPQFNHEGHLGQIIDDATEVLSKAKYKLKFITS